VNEHDDQATPHSGSRWEPGTPAEEAGGPPVRPIRRRRRRAAVAGAAVALFAVGGVGGFAMGSAVGNDGDGPQTGVVPGPGRDGHGFHGGPPHGGRPGPRDVPGDDGTGEDGDGDGDGTT